MLPLHCDFYSNSTPPRNSNEQVGIASVWMTNNYYVMIIIIITILIATDDGIGYMDMAILA